MPEVTATPSIADPPFLDQWEKFVEPPKLVHVFQTTDGPYQRVQLFNFKFLGKPFDPRTYLARKGVAGDPKKPLFSITAAGVCAEMRQLLYLAQRRIYRSYAAQLGPGETPTEHGFIKWIDQPPVSGWQFKSSQHGTGSAIDIDAGSNPYIATGTIDEPGGEAMTTIPVSELRAVHVRALVAYDHIWRLFQGEQLGNQVSGIQSGESTAKAYDRFAAMSAAFMTYFQLAFIANGHNGVANNHLLVSQPGVQRPFGPESEAGSFLAQLKRYEPLLPGLATFGSNEALHDNIVTDYPAVRLVMAYGSLSPANPGFANSKATFSQSRDPCYGFLHFRKEIAVGIRDALLNAEEAKLVPETKVVRWGALDFGGKYSGDMMHFDRGVQPVIAFAAPDPNPDGLFYYKP